jgi:hypothetical protein
MFLIGTKKKENAGGLLVLAPKCKDMLKRKCVLMRSQTFTGKKEKDAKVMHIKIYIARN